MAFFGQMSIGSALSPRQLDEDFEADDADSDKASQVSLSGGEDSDIEEGDFPETSPTFSVQAESTAVSSRGPPVPSLALRSSPTPPADGLHLPRNAQARATSPKPVSSAQPAFSLNLHQVSRPQQNAASSAPALTSRLQPAHDASEGAVDLASGPQHPAGSRAARQDGPVVDCHILSSFHIGTTAARPNLLGSAALQSASVQLGIDASALKLYQLVPVNPNRALPPDSKLALHVAASGQ